MSNVRDFGAMGDGTHDDLSAFEHCLRDGDGFLELPPGDYRFSKPLVVRLAETGRFGLCGSGGVARILMHGPGPAISLLGTHTATADPAGFRPDEWVKERMPTVADVEIVGEHPEADGIRIEGVMQPTISGVLLRHLRTAIHVTGRARNLLVSHCHIYNNTGVGVHLDQVNLHQAIITGSHISYCRLGGIRLERSELRNIQITGNDIEYNNNRAHKVEGADAVPTAEIYIDTGEGSIREGTIASNTIQATYSPGGANIRFIGQSPKANHRGGMWTISGNLIGSQDYNVWLTSVRGVTLTGNVIYSGHQRNLLIEHCRNIVVGANSFDHNPDYEPNELCTGIRITDSVDILLQGLLIQDAQAGKHTWKGAGGTLERAALLELIRCQRLNLSGVQVIDPAPVGIQLEDCTDSVITGCTILETREQPLMAQALTWTGSGTGNLLAASRLGKGTAAPAALPDHVRTEALLRD